MDAPTSTNGLRDAFPYTQLVYLALAPVAIYTRAILSHDRLSAIRQTPPFEFPSSPTGELASDEKQVGRAKEKSDGSPAPPVEQSWKRSRALGGAVCCVLLVVDLLLLRASSTWQGACWAAGASVFVTLPGADLIWELIEGKEQAFVRSISGFVVVETRRRYSLLYFVACNLAAFAVVPSLLHTPALYPFVPLSIVMLGRSPTGSRTSIKAQFWNCIFSVCTAVGGVLVVPLLSKLSKDPEKPTVKPTFIDEDAFKMLLYETFAMFSVVTQVILLVTILYRFDRHISNGRSSTSSAITYIAGADRKVVIKSMRQVLREDFFKGNTPTLNYFNLGLLSLLLCMSLPSVAAQLLYFTDKSVAPWVSCGRFLGLYLSLCVIPLAVYALARFRGETESLMAYEEDWGSELERDGAEVRLSADAAV